MGALFGLLAFAFALLGGAVFAYFKQQRRVAVIGTVVELTSRITSIMPLPVVEFTAVSREKVRFTSGNTLFAESYTVGQSVNVRCDPADPNKAEVKSKANIWLVPAILVLMGILVCGLVISLSSCRMPDGGHPHPGGGGDTGPP